MARDASHARPTGRFRFVRVIRALCFVALCLLATAWFVSGYWDFAAYFPRSRGRDGYTVLALTAGVLECGQNPPAREEEWPFTTFAAVPPAVGWRYRWRFAPLVHVRGTSWGQPLNEWGWQVVAPLWAPAVVIATGLFVPYRRRVPRTSPAAITVPTDDDATPTA